MSTTGTQPSKQAEPHQRTPEELEFIKWMERQLGREPTEREINLWVDQARAFGALSGQPSKPSAVILRSPSCWRREHQMSNDKDQMREPVDWCQLSVDAMNRHTTSPEFAARYKAWLEKIGPELWGPVGKADYEKIIAEGAAAKQAEAKK